MIEKNDKSMDWEKLSKEEKIKVVNEVLEKEIRPFIKSHGGDVNLMDVNDNEVIISYEGACAGCPSSSCSTLMAIQRVLQEKIYKDISVTPY